MDPRNPGHGTSDAPGVHAGRSKLSIGRLGRLLIDCN